MPNSGKSREQMERDLNIKTLWLCQFVTWNIIFPAINKTELVQEQTKQGHCQLNDQLLLSYLP